MTAEFSTIPDILAALDGAGPNEPEPVVAAVEAVKRYLYGKGAKRWGHQPYQGPNGPVPTTAKLFELIDKLRDWVFRHALTVNMDPLSAFRNIELIKLGASGSSGFAGSFSAGRPSKGQWENAARMADETLNELTTRIRGRNEKQGEAGNDSAEWMTVTECSRVCVANPGVITRAVNEGKLRSNGKRGNDRRINALDFLRWAQARAKKPVPQESDAYVEEQMRKNAAN
jgi:hypothetical protein